MTGAVTAGLAIGFAALGVGICFLGGVVAITKGCEVLNEHITKGT